MSEQAGRKASISIVGEPVEMVNQPMTDISLLQNGSLWIVSDPAKRLLSEYNSLTIHFFGIPFTAQSGTTTTNIKKTAHGLVTGDEIQNASRGAARRTITKVDNDNFTVSTITGQTTGDTIEQVDTLVNNSANILGINYMKSTWGFNKSISSVYIEAYFLPKTLVATANDYSYNQATDMGDVTPFLATHKKRMPLLKYASGTLSYWDITDPYFTDALLADTPKYIVLEDGISQKALLAYFDKTELKASIGNPQSMTVGFINSNEEVG